MPKYPESSLFLDHVSGFLGPMARKSPRVHGPLLRLKLLLTVNTRITTSIAITTTLNEPDVGCIWFYHLTMSTRAGTVQNIKNDSEGDNGCDEESVEDSKEGKLEKARTKSDERVSRKCCHNNPSRDSTLRTTLVRYRLAIFCWEVLQRSRCKYHVLATIKSRSRPILNNSSPICSDPQLMNNPWTWF